MRKKIVWLLCLALLAAAFPVQVSTAEAQAPAEPVPSPMFAAPTPPPAAKASPTPASAFKFDAETGAITGLSEGMSLTKLIIPAEINGVAVTSIGYEAFEDCTSLTSVTIPNSVTEIGGYAFENCTSLTSVTIPNSVTEIGYEAFYNCTSLTSVTIPNSVTEIGGSTFRGCTSLTAINVDSANTAYASHEGVLYNKEMTEMVKCPEGKAGAYTVPEGVTYIYFSDCTSLTSVTIGNGVTSIGDWAFDGCTSLTSVTIPDSVTEISNYAFEGCTSLTSVTIPDSVTSMHISERAFSGCDNLQYNTYDNADYLGNETNPYVVLMWAENREITACKIHPSTKVICDRAFEDCTSLTNVTIGNSVTSIGGSAFRGCTSLTSVTIPDSVTTIGDFAFYECTSLTSVTIPDSVTTIGASAFSGCDNLQYNIYDNAKYLGNKTNPYVVLMEAENQEITACEIHPNTKVIYEDAFRDCKSLTGVTIPNSVKTIGDSAFYGCYSLTSITIPNSVTSIGFGAFYNCESLTSVTIPDSVKTIDCGAFAYCTSLANVTIGNSVTEIENGAFGGCTSLTNVTIPDSVTTIGYDAFFGTSLTSVTIPESVTEIGWNAFTCAPLKEINVDPANTAYTSHEGVLYNKEMTEIFKCPEGKSGKYVIPDGVVYIHSGISMFGMFPCRGAFYDCDLLTSVTIPDSMTSIGNDAFGYCKSLTSVTIPDSVKSIGRGAFLGCTSLADITIPDGVGYIASQTFDGCESLTSLTIPDSVTGIAYLAFASCTSLASVTIPNSVTYIGSGAFQSCKALTRVTIGNGVTSIGEGAFSGCTSLPAINVDEANTAYVSQNGVLFTKDMKTLHTYPEGKLGTTYVIPDSVTSIGDFAFCGCTSLTSVTIPDSVTEIGYAAFSGCKSLTAINVDSANTAFASHEGVLYNKEMTKMVKCPEGKAGSCTIPASVTTIGDWAFYNCSSLTAINVDSANTAYASQNGVLFTKDMKTLHTYPAGKPGTTYVIPDSVTSISGSAFRGCTSLTAINVDPANTDFASHEGVLYNKEITRIVKCPEGKAGSYTIPNSVTEIGWNAFKGCTSLTNMTIPDSVTEIGGSAFEDCTSLTSVTIPDSVTEIGWYAFCGCTSLTDVYYAGTEVQWKAIQIDGVNEPLLGASIHYNCVPVERTFADEAAGVSVTGSVPNIIPEGAVLKAEKVGTTEEGVVYDISLVKGGAKVQPKGSVSVKIPVPEGLDGSACKVYRVEADGSYTDMRATYDGAGFMTFSTDHFSKYLVTDKALGDANDDGEVDNLDAALVLRYDAGLIDEADIANFDFADVTGDGEVDNLDAAMILRYDAGLIEGF